MTRDTLGPAGDHAFTVRPAREDDAVAVRRLLAQALLAAGFGAPDESRDADLAQPEYYEAPGRGAWVAEDGDGRVAGFAALDHGEGAFALLTRLVGAGLPELLDAAAARAREERYAAIEAVVPPSMTAERRAAEAAGFLPATPGNTLLLRRML